MASRIITGFIEGIIRTTTAGDEIILPFSDKIEGVTFRWESENTIVETFSQQGIKGATAACPFREMGSIEFRSKALAWSFLQAATGYLDQEATDPEPVTFSTVLSQTSGSPGSEVSTITLPSTPVVGLSVLVADEDGKQIAGTVSGTTVTLTENLTNQKVTVNYFKTPIADTRQIALGAGTRIGEVAVYGQFFGCPGSILMYANRGVIKSALEFGIETDAAQAALTIDLLRDDKGAFAYLTKLD